MNLQANLQQMNTDAKDISSAAADYLASVKTLYGAVEELSNSWKGTDNTEYANKVNSYKDEIDALGKIVNNYATFLNRAAASLQELQGEISSAAGRL